MNDFVSLIIAVYILLYILRTLSSDLEFKVLREVKLDKNV